MPSMRKSVTGPTTVRERFDEYRHRIATLAMLMDTPDPVTIKDAELADLTGMTQGQVVHTRRILLFIGAVEYRGGKGHGAGIWRWKRFGQDLENAISTEMERQMRGGLAPDTMRRKQRGGRVPVRGRAAERVSIELGRDTGIESHAVVGPDPLPQIAHQLSGHGGDAPAALVLAAKQYRARREGGDEKANRARKVLEELKAIGVPVPRELEAAATVAVDGRLETILLVVPYIEQLERSVAGIADLRAQAASAIHLQQQVDRQAEQIRRLVSARTMEAMESPAKGRS